MTSRVLLGPLPSGAYGLRVSRPGFDVTNPALTGQQISFSSEWAQAGIIFAKGSVSVPTGSFGYTSVAFGVTFSRPPPVIAYADRSSVLTPLQRGNVYGTYSGWWDSIVAEPIRIFTDHVEFVEPVSAAGGGYLARYIIMRPL